ncbi:hypothetical protein CEY09_05385 [Achromobacter marplatensis]|uniref:Uncharacterized protein n=1 Tax=Achromobacter marplatensis TaxID=470868 RepID=A0ABX9GE59_9BURK|nr:hypothetical protein CEY09_05385 [Achromobacter marplatensis]RBP22622.1 hypothetical protein DFP87_102364 [Achromobacter marplatensis]CAB3648548.1 hypothetical protein LMG26219_02628 [Achromobacter marplatensis]
MTRVVGINELGLRVGEDHHRATLTDHDVELMREIRETEGLGYKRLAKMFDVSVAHVRNIVHYRVRVQVPTRWKTLR